MLVIETEFGPVRRADGCKDDYDSLVVYDQPPAGGTPIILQRAAMRSFQICEERYAKERWRPGFPKKVTQRIDPEIWGKQREGKREFRPIYLTGSIRSCDTQARLYKSDSNRYAPPDVGVHTHGLAIDVHTGYLNAVIRRILFNHGWTQSRPDDEPWHRSFGVTA
jgi:hypothetical protein